MDPAAATALNSVSFDLNIVNPCLSNTVSIEPISDDFYYEDGRTKVNAHLRLQESITIDAVTDYELISSFADYQICGAWKVAFKVEG